MSQLQAQREGVGGQYQYQRRLYRLVQGTFKSEVEVAKKRKSRNRGGKVLHKNMKVEPILHLAVAAVGYVF